MSHEVETMAWANDVPWHGLGVNVSPDQSIEEWRTAAGLDWDLVQRDLYTMGEDGPELYPHRVYWERSSDGKLMIPSASPKWAPWYNNDLIDMMKRWATGLGCRMETLGSLRGGSVIWALASLNDGYTVGTSDVVKGYLLLTSSHIVGKANDIRLTPIRVVCANTMAMAQNNSNVVYRQDHTSAFDTKQAQEAVEKAHEGLAKAGRRANTIAKLKIGIDDAIEKVLLPIIEPDVMGGDPFPTVQQMLEDKDKLPRSIRQIIESAETAPGATPGTGWGIMNGVTYWTDHVKGYSRDARMTNAWLGNTGKLKNEIEDKLLELAS
jgi:phage/plasmid-like protein (TIGR03299 family)